MTVYMPPAFREDDRATLHAMLRTARLATLISNGADGVPEISYLPFVFDDADPAAPVLLGHVARANPHWKSLAAADGGAPVRATVIVQGADAYVSPTFYPTKPVHHRHVPTWNYEVVHATGGIEVFHDAERLRDVVSRLTERFEAGREAPWRIDQAPPDYITAMLRGIVGVRVTVEELQGKRKLSQNREAVDRRGVRDALADSTDAGERGIAQAIDAIDALRR